MRRMMIVGGALVLWPVLAQAQIVNGSFEQATGPSAAFPPCTGPASAQTLGINDAANVQLDGWQGYQPSRRWNSARARQGGCYLELGTGNTAGGVLQSLSLTPGAQYDVSFWISKNFDAFATPRSLDLLWLTGAPADNAAFFSLLGVGTYTATATSTPTDNMWQEYTARLTATQSTMYLGFRGITVPNTNSFIAIDDVSMSAVEPPPPATTVPEPSTYLLMGTGLAGLVALRRRSA